jgi:hypothetical protein
VRAYSRHNRLVPAPAPVTSPPESAWAQRVPTAALAPAGLIGGFAVALATGSRPLGGVLMAACGLPCIAVWAARDGRGTAVRLTVAGLLAFAASHGLGLLIGAWPAVLLVSAAMAALCWRASDARHRAA